MSTVRISSRSAHRWLDKVTAILILGLLAADLTDASCDPLVFHSVGQIVSGMQERRVDPCTGICVPDCFCCSSSVPAFHLTWECQPTPSVGLPPLPMAGLSPGFSQPLDHVPIA
jgi:hypothetical protein